MSFQCSIKNKFKNLKKYLVNYFERQKTKETIRKYSQAFNLMDQDRDGTVSLDDLKEVYASLGKAPKDAELKAMLDEAQGPVNFTTLLTLFGDRLNGTADGTGQINQKR